MENLSDAKKYKCPFCGGTGITPFTGRLGQKCTECGQTGELSARQVKRLGVESFVQQYLEKKK